MSILPPALLASLQHIPGYRDEAFRSVHADGSQVVSIRLHPQKVDSLPSSLQLEAEPIPWCAQGYYLSQRPSFTLDPLLHAGAYYVQEASSMFIAHALKQLPRTNEAWRVLDLCAAPGGKSTLLQGVLREKDLLVSNEVIKTRVSILTENLTKWGLPQVIVTNNDPKDFARLPHYFDLMLIDAPCSGSGLFRRDPAAIDEWSEQHVLMCSQRQQRIIADAWTALKPGGYLLYSTCSFSPIEDEAIADWVGTTFGGMSVRIPIDEAWGIVETTGESGHAYGYRFFPDRVKGEGFYLTVIQKQYADSANKSTVTSKRSPTKGLLDKNVAVQVSSYLQGHSYFFFQQEDMILAMLADHESDFRVIQQALYIRKAGVTVGSWIHQALVPAHDLAVSTICGTQWESVELDLTQALQFLRMEPMALEPGVTGWCKMTYGGLGLGWAKRLPNRMNNYYPKEWRIRMRDTP
jgi:16S rRNA C967 or C1407 C5-methylase (RsmB/RsmF family)/NOL1/NOP2/fmu family ribosome biogenesis protein